MILLIHSKTSQIITKTTEIKSILFLAHFSMTNKNKGSNDHLLKKIAKQQQK